MSKRLILHRIPTDFEPENDIAVGPWCFIGAEDVCSDWEDLPFVEPFSTPDTLAAADLKSRRLANQLAVEWAEALNRRHGRQYSVAYWRTLVILWLVAGVQSTWRRFRHVEELVARHGEEHLTVRVLDGPPNWPISHLHAFMAHLTEDDRFDFWMTSEIVRALAPGRWTLLPTAYDPGQAAREVDGEDGIERYSGMSAALRRVIGRLPLDSIHGVRLGKILLSLYVNALPRTPRHLADGYRDDSIRGEFPSPYLDFLDRFLSATLPATVGDRYPDLEAEARRLRYAPGRLLVDHVSSMDDGRRTIIAQAQEAGERLVGHQHGGWYGSARTEPWAAEAEYRHDAFLTWGWEKQEDLEGRMIPLPSPYLSRLRDKHEFRDDTLILVGAKMFVRSPRLDSVPGPADWLAYRRSKRAFVDALAAEVRGELRYRPYAKARETLADEKYMRKFFPDLRILDGSLDEAMLTCRLLALDHTGTTLNIALAANVPTVCFRDPRIWALSRQARTVFEGLARVGILYDNPRSAAAHVNRIWADVPGWWHSRPVQDARRAWCRHYARTAGFWWWHWLKALWRLAREEPASA